MNETPASEKRLRILWLAVGIFAFGILMGARNELPSAWQRSLTAGAAAALLVLCVAKARHHNRPSDEPSH